MNKDMFSQYPGLKENIQFTWPIYKKYHLNSGDELIKILKKRDKLGTNSTKSIEDLSKSPNRLYIHHLDLHNIDPEYNPYSPLKEKDLFLEEKDLFLKFANVDINNDTEILDFVNRYSYPEAELYYPLDKFKKEVNKANELIEIYDLLVKNNIKKLKKIINIKDNKSWLWRFTTINIKEKFNIRKDSNKLNEEGVINLFIRYILNNIYQVLDGNIAPTFKEVKYNSEGFSEYINTGSPEKRFKVKPGWYCKNLLTAIYMQFYFVITENKTIDYCAYCNKPLLKEKGDKEYHEQCRKNAYKSRRIKAFKLWNQGCPAKEIYKIIDKEYKPQKSEFQLYTIEGWVTGWNEYKNEAQEMWENGSSAHEIYIGLNKKIKLRDIDSWVANWENEKS